MARLSIVLFGPLRATLDGEPLSGFYSDKVRALLAYLAVESGRPHRRETLVGLFWPESPERSARHSLSQALHNLRQALGLDECGADEDLCLATTTQSVTLSAAPGCIDAIDFAALLEDCEAHDHVSLASCPVCRERLQQAVSLYTGDLLAGFSLADSPAFEEWLLLQRERFGRLVVDALRGLASPGASCDASVPLQAARQWVELDPLDDEARRALMRALASSGHRGAALAQFERFADTLAGELGVDPEPATVALAEGIRCGSLSEGKQAGAPEAGPLAEAGPAELRAPPAFLSSPERYLPPLFVARERELAQLNGHLEAVLAGHPRVVFVTGEPGSGKTALLREFQQRALAADDDLVTAVGHCNAHTGLGDPYLAFREILAQLTGDVEAAWAAGAISGEQARRLWHLLPEIGQDLVDAGPDVAGAFLPGGALLDRARAAGPDAAWMPALERLISDWTARRGEQLEQPALFSQVTAVLQRLARRHPLVLVLEDLHWTDAGTLALLFHLGCHLEGDRVLIVGSYRPAEVFAPVLTGGAAQEGRHPLVPVMHEFARRYGQVDVDLNRTDGQGFVNALLDSEPNALGSDFRAMLLQQCAGNALFTVEVLRDLQERGRLMRDARGHWMEAASPDWGSLPARVEGILAERIGRLAPALQEALRVASVEGESFSVAVLAQVLGREPPGVVRWLSNDLGRTHHLVSPLEAPRAGTATLGRYRFRHILVQNYVYGTLDVVERAYLHRAVAEAIEATAEGDGDDHVPALARHYEQAGDAERASAYLHRAGDRAMRLVAFSEAEELYGRGLSLLASVPQSRERDEAEIALLLRL
ncbi:MAG: BREX system ATP-binding domain-containing protein, partial [Anaerolineae bacterium]